MQQRFLIAILLLLGLNSCKVYNQNIMFKTKENVKSSKLVIESYITQAQKNYLIQKQDYLEIRVYSNEGEIIIEPPSPDNRGLNGDPLQNQQLLQQTQGLGAVQGNQFPLQTPIFLVQEDGFAKLPKVGKVKLENLTLDQADSLLEIKFNEFYKDCYVRTRYSNKRVIVFKGTTGLVFPLRNEKISLLEVLASTGGMPNDVRATNIRLIRGDLQDPEVLLINLSTIEGMRKQNLIVEPNDIIYIEPIRKTFLETLGDISPILSTVTSIATLFFIFGR